MKLLLVGSLVVLGICQISRAEYNPEDEIGGVVGDCLAEQKLDNHKILQKLRGKVIPEDDKDVLSFYDCFGKKLHLVNSNGDINYKGFEEYYNDTTGHFGPEVKAKVVGAVQECGKNPPTGLSVGLTVLRVGKCIEEHLE